MYYVLVLALAAIAYAFIPDYLAEFEYGRALDYRTAPENGAALKYSVAPDYLGAYYNNLIANKLMGERLKLENKEGLNHLMLVVAIRELADVVTNLPHAYSYIYDETIEKVINRVLASPLSEARYLSYRRMQADAMTAEVQDIVKKYCSNSLLLLQASCNKDVDKAVKKRNLQSSGRHLLALGDVSYDYLSMIPKFDQVAKNDSAEDYLRNEGREGLVALVEKIEAINKNL